MEEVTVMMISSPENALKVTVPQKPVTTTTSPSWKLYDNPFYNPQHYGHHQHQQHFQNSKHLLHHPRLPPSARTIAAASFWDLTTLFGPAMETELDVARAQIVELKAELEYERKSRKKAETLNKKLAKELAKEIRGREALEIVCEELAREISSEKSEMGRMKKEMEEERNMLRMAEVFREERVQMKLTEAKILFEEKLLELEGTNKHAELFRNSILELERKMQEEDGDQDKDKKPEIATASKAAANVSVSGKFSCRLVLSERSRDDNGGAYSSRDQSTRADHISSSASSITNPRRAPPEPENPHIKRGIKGFVEFPRVVRAIGSKNRHWGSKVECQKAQLKLLLKQKSPIRSNNIIIT